MKFKKKIRKNNYAKIIIFINMDVREILVGHKSKGYSCNSELIGDRM